VIRFGSVRLAAWFGPVRPKRKNPLRCIPSTNSLSVLMCRKAVNQSYYPWGGMKLLHSYKSLWTCLICSTSTILSTNGLNSADVPLSNKQTKQTGPQKHGVAVGISLLSCLQVEIYVFPDWRPPSWISDFRLRRTVFLIVPLDTLPQKISFLSCLGAEI